MPFVPMFDVWQNRMGAESDRGRIGWGPNRMGGSLTTSFPSLVLRAAGQMLQHVADPAVRFQRVPELFIDHDSVRISSPDPCDFHVTSLHQFCHDFLHHALSDSHEGGDFPQSHFGVAVQAEQHMSVICQERPATRCRRL